jgi:2-phospho-L-lactate guanylyltransferase
LAGNQTWAVLPAKPFDEAKSRLESVLSATERYGLARALLLRTLRVLQASEAVTSTLVVSPDPLVLTLAAGEGATTLQETRGGLNRALAQARRQVLAAGAPSLLVIAADLPLLAASEVDALFDAGDAAVVIAPDRRGQGTNALLLRPPDAIEFAFGEGSFARHTGLAGAAGLALRQVSLPGLSFDLDVADDWRDLQALGWQEGLSLAAGGVAATSGRPAPAPRGRRPSA